MALTGLVNAYLMRLALNITMNKMVYETYEKTEQNKQHGKSVFTKYRETPNYFKHTVNWL